MLLADKRSLSLCPIRRGSRVGASMPPRKLPVFVREVCLAQVKRVVVLIAILLQCAGSREHAATSRFMGSDALSFKGIIKDPAQVGAS